MLYTILLIFSSVIFKLFISFSSYMNYTLNTASEVAGEIPYDYQITYFKNDNDKEALDKINEIY